MTGRHAGGLSQRNQPDAIACRGGDRDGHAATGTGPRWLHGRLSRRRPGGRPGSTRPECGPAHFKRGGLTMLRRTFLGTALGAMTLAAAAAPGRKRPRHSTGSAMAAPPTRSGLLPAGRRALGGRHRQHRQYQLLLGRFVRPAGSDPSAIAAGADGIVTTSPDPGSLIQVIDEVNAAASPGRELQHLGRIRGLPGLCRQRPVHRGPALGAVSGRQRPCRGRRFRLAAGRGSGRVLRRRGRKGIATVFEPLGITWESPRRPWTRPSHHPHVGLSDRERSPRSTRSSAW